MSVDPAIFRAMVASGATPEMLLAVVEAAAAVEEEKRERKRAGNAARQQAFRDRQKGESNDSNALQGVTERDGVTHPPSLDKETSPRPPKEINPIPATGNTRARAVTAHVLPDGWKPRTLATDTVAGEIVVRRGQEWARRTFESFENHWRSANGPNARKKDWQRTWANWVIEQDNRDGRRNGSRTDGMGGNRSGSVSGYGRTIDAAQRFVARHNAAPG